jgi:hypothetical protein
MWKRHGIGASIVALRSGELSITYYHYDDHTRHVTITQIERVRDWSTFLNSPAARLFMAADRRHIQAEASIDFHPVPHEKRN